MGMFPPRILSPSEFVGQRVLVDMEEISASGNSADKLLIFPLISNIV